MTSCKWRWYVYQAVCPTCPTQNGMKLEENENAIVGECIIQRHDFIVLSNLYFLTLH